MDAGGRTGADVGKLRARPLLAVQLAAAPDLVGDSPAVEIRAHFPGHARPDVERGLRRAPGLLLDECQGGVNLRNLHPMPAVTDGIVRHHRAEFAAALHERVDLPPRHVGRIDPDLRDLDVDEHGDSAPFEEGNDLLVLGDRAAIDGHDHRGSSAGRIG